MAVVGSTIDILTPGLETERRAHHIKTYQCDLSNFLHFMKNVFHSR